jgi:hypothetical protein
LKGASAFLGATEVASLCERLTGCAVGEQAAALGLVAALEREFDRARLSLEAAAGGSA